MENQMTYKHYNICTDFLNTWFRASWFNVNKGPTDDGCVTPETCRVTWQWINVCILLHRVGPLLTYALTSYILYMCRRWHCKSADFKIKQYCNHYITTGFKISILLPLLQQFITSTFRWQLHIVIYNSTYAEHWCNHLNFITINSINSAILWVRVELILM